MATGLQTTTTINNTQDLVVKDFAELITRLMPNGTAPLFGMTSQLKSETALSFEHGFFTKTMIFPQATTHGSTILAATTSLTVVDSSQLIPGMVLRVSTTGENVLVTAVSDSTHVTVTRGFGGTAGNGGQAADIAASTVLFQVGNAVEEGSSRPTAVSIVPQRVTNLTQIFRNAWQLTDSARAIQTIAGEANVAESRAECAKFHATDIESAIFFGRKQSSTQNNKPFRTMDGLISQIKQNASANITTAGSTTNFTQLETALEPVFNTVTDMAQPNSRVIFCGGQARRVFNQIGRLNGTYELYNGETSYGLQFATFRTTRGEFSLIEHPLFNQPNVPYLAKLAVVVDLASINLAYLGNRKTMDNSYGVDGKPVENGVDAVGGDLLTEMTLMVKNPAACAVVENLTAGAAG